MIHENELIDACSAYVGMVSDPRTTQGADSLAFLQEKAALWFMNDDNVDRVFGRLQTDYCLEEQSFCTKALVSGYGDPFADIDPVSRLTRAIHNARFDLAMRHIVYKSEYSQRKLPHTADMDERACLVLKTECDLSNQEWLNDNLIGARIGGKLHPDLDAGFDDACDIRDIPRSFLIARMRGEEFIDEYKWVLASYIEDGDEIANPQAQEDCVRFQIQDIVTSPKKTFDDYREEVQGMNKIFSGFSNFTEMKAHEENMRKMIEWNENNENLDPALMTLFPKGLPPSN
jgi:hypothetical protein